MHNKKLLILLTVFFMLFSVSVSAQESLVDMLLGSGTGQNEAGLQESGETVLIVEVDGTPLLRNSAGMYRSGSAVRTQMKANLSVQSEVQSEIQKLSDLPIQIEHTYTNVLNGFSVRVQDASDIEKIAALPGVKRVSVSQAYKLPELIPGQAQLEVAEGGEARLATSTGLIGADKLNDAGFNGEGQVVAVLDSELDVNHEFFGQEPVNPKYTKNDIEELLRQEGLHFNLTADDVYKSAKIPFAYDYALNNPEVYDASNIHGSHVSGTVAGKGGTGPDGSTAFSGVAPEAQIVFMKVFDGEYAWDDIIIQAIDDSVKLGVSAINMSLGTDYAQQYCSLPFLEAVSNARKAGVFVACAAGNATMGYEDNIPLTENIEYGAGGTPAAYSEATSVAGYANTALWLNELILDDGTKVPFTEGNGQEKFAQMFSDKPYSYIYAGYGTKEEFDALLADGADLSDKIALVKQFGPEGMTSAEKFANAEAAGAIGSIFWFTEELEYGISVAETEFPTCIVQNSMGELMSAKGSGTLRANPISVMVPLERDDALYTYTSWGTDETLELKPEIMAPGEGIYSSVPDGQYMSFSGTSMATPHIAGAVALLNQWYEQADNTTVPKGEGINRADYLEALMMSTSTIVKQKNGVPYSPRRQSAGLLNRENAVKSPVILRGDGGKPKLSLKDHMNQDFTLQFTAENTSASQSATYDKLTVYTMTDGYVEENGETLVKGTVMLSNVTSDFSPVTIAPGAAEDIGISVSLDAAELEKNAAMFPNGFYIDGFAELSSVDGSVPPVHLPFMGFYGDWLDAPLFDTNYYDDEYAVQGTSLEAGMPEEQWIQLGINLLNGEKNKERIAFSPNGDGVADELAVNSCLLRGASEVIWELKNEAGDAVAMAEQKNASKFYLSRATFDLPESLPDGRYTVSGYGYHVYDAEKERLFTFGEELPVVVDTQAPEITEAILTEKNGKTYLTVTVSDNFNVQGIALLSDEFESSQADWQKDVDSANASAEFDITGCDPAKISISAVDYAMNEINRPFLAEVMATVSSVSTNGFAVTLDHPLELAKEQLTLRESGRDVPISGLTKMSDTTYSVRVGLAYETEYTLSFDVGDTVIASVTFMTPVRPSSSGGSGGGNVIRRPAGTTTDTPADTDTVFFRDVKQSDWFYEAVTQMAQRGILLGKGDGSFAPDETVRRADFLIMVMRAYQIEPDASVDTNFADAGNTYYTAYLAKAKAAGIVNGTGDNRFAPEDTLTRQDMFVMLYRILDITGNMPVSQGTPQMFRDAQQIAGYAEKAIGTLSAAGVVSGFDGLVNPQAYTLRSEAAQVLYNLMK